MYICICRKVSDQSINDAIAQGADNRVALTNALGVGSGCGKCMDVIDEMIDSQVAQNKNAGHLNMMPTLFVPTSA